jgi:PKD repeat protein
MKSLRTSYSLILIAFAMLPSLLQAQTLTLGATPKQVFCAGEEFEIAYTAAGAFTPQNSFVIQMSDANGSFSTFKSIGSLRTTSSGTITATIPTDIANGTAYRLRVMSSSPYAVSADNGQNLTMGGVPVPRIGDGPDNRGFYAMLGQPITFDHRSTNAATVRWEFGPDAIPPVSIESTPTVTYTTPGYKVVTLTAISAGGCEATDTVSLSSGDRDDDYMKVLVYVGTCTPRIPAHVKIDSFESTFDSRESGSFWVVPGGVHDEFGPTNSEFFIEPGGTLYKPSYFNVVYVKAGGSLTMPSRSSFVIYEDGASIDEGTRGVLKNRCDDLEFDYSVAPPYKINQASVAKQEEKQGFIYPNPVANTIHRSNSSELLLEARLYNVTGALVASSVQPQGSEILSVSTLPAGLYNLELHFADAIRFQKIVVQR